MSKKKNKRKKKERSTINEKIYIISNITYI